LCPDPHRNCNDRVCRVLHSTPTSSISSEDLPTVGTRSPPSRGRPRCLGSHKKSQGLSSKWSTTTTICLGDHSVWYGSRIVLDILPEGTGAFAFEYFWRLFGIIGCTRMLQDPLVVMQACHTQNIARQGALDGCNATMLCISIRNPVSKQSGRTRPS